MIEVMADKSGGMSEILTTTVFGVEWGPPPNNRYGVGKFV